MEPKGTVVWYAKTRGVSWQAHKFSLLDAIETASLMLKTDRTKHREELLVSPDANALLSTLPQFKPAEFFMGLMPTRTSVDGQERPLTGEINNRQVLLDPEASMLIRVRSCHAQADVYINTTTETTEMPWFTTDKKETP